MDHGNPFDDMHESDLLIVLGCAVVVSTVAITFFGAHLARAVVLRGVRRVLRRA